MFGLPKATGQHMAAHPFPSSLSLADRPPAVFAALTTRSTRAAEKLLSLAKSCLWPVWSGQDNTCKQDLLRFSLEQEIATDFVRCGSCEFSVGMLVFRRIEKSFIKIVQALRLDMDIQVPARL